MTENAMILPKAFAVRFVQVKRWDPNSFHDIEWHWPASAMAAIGSVLKPRKEKVDRSANGFNDLMPVTIHFDGSIEPRKVNEDREYTMELFWARPGDIVVSKIDLKNGAVAIIPGGWDKVVVTNHFAVYEPDLKKLDPKYFHLVIQAKFFKEHLWRNKVGAEGRKEVKLDFFESLEVPIPSLLIQQKIVEYWKGESFRANTCVEQSKELNNSIPNYLVSEIGLKQLKQAHSRRAFVSSWKEIDRWGVNLAREMTCRPNLSKSFFPIVSLSEVIVDLETGWSPKSLNRPANTDEWGTLKLGAISFGKFNEIENKALPAKMKSKPQYEVKAGDLLICRGNVPRYVGACALAGKVRAKLMLCDLMFRVIWKKNSLILPEYLDEIFKIPHLRWQIETSLTGTSPTMKKISKPGLMSLKFPLPPLNIQKRIIATITEMREESNLLEKKANAVRDKFTKTVEKLILGTLSVEKL
jgi:type I restriction enzyme, S subunit